MYIAKVIPIAICTRQPNLPFRLGSESCRVTRNPLKYFSTSVNSLAKGYEQDRAAFRYASSSRIAKFTKDVRIAHETGRLDN